MKGLSVIEGRVRKPRQRLSIQDKFNLIDNVRKGRSTGRVSGEEVLVNFMVKVLLYYLY